MGLNITDACNWLKTSPPEDELRLTHKSIKRKIAMLTPHNEPQKEEALRVCAVIDSAISDISIGNGITTYRTLLTAEELDLIDSQGDTPPAQKEGHNITLDPSPLVNYDDETVVLCAEEKHKAFNELKARFDSRSC